MVVKVVFTVQRLIQNELEKVIPHVPVKVIPHVPVPISSSYCGVDWTNYFFEKFFDQIGLLRKFFKQFKVDRMYEGTS